MLPLGMLDRLIKHQKEPELGHESTQATLCRWQTKTGIKVRVGKSYPLTPRNTASHLHVHYTIYSL